MCHLLFLVTWEGNILFPYKFYRTTSRKGDARAAKFLKITMTKLCLSCFLPRDDLSNAGVYGESGVRDVPERLPIF